MSTGYTTMYVLLPRTLLKVYSIQHTHREIIQLFAPHLTSKGSFFVFQWTQSLCCEYLNSATMCPTSMSLYIRSKKIAVCYALAVCVCSVLITGIKSVLKKWYNTRRASSLSASSSPLIYVLFHTHFVNSHKRDNICVDDIHLTSYCALRFVVQKFPNDFKVSHFLIKSSVNVASLHIV